MRRRLAHLALERGGLIGLVTLISYLWLAPRHIVDGDNAEFSTLATTGGVAHPSGYPLYVLWLRAMSWLPAAAGAHRAALATAILGAAAIVVLHAAARAWGARPLAASLAVAIVAAGPVVLRVHTEAEVFAMNALIVATVLWLAAANGPLRGQRRAFALGLVGGLGMANHLTAVLLAPVGLLGAVRGVREATIRKPLAIGLAVLGLIVGLSPYLYLLVAPAGQASWGHVDSLGDVLAVVTRQDYGGLGAFAPHKHTEIDPIANVLGLARTLGRSWLWLPALLGLGALALRCARRGDHETRAGWWALAASWLLAGPLLVARFNLPPDHFWRFIIERFHLLPIVVLAVPVAIGIDLALARIPARLAAVTESAAIGQGVAVAVFVAVAASSLAEHQAVDSRAVEAGIANMLKSLPADAVVVTESDDLYFGTNYAQLVLGLRPDVTQVAGGIVALPWYRARLARRGLALDPFGPGKEPGDPESVRIADQILATGRPLFVEINLGNVLRTFTNYPYGTLFRVLPRGAKQLALDDIIAINKKLYEAFDFDYPHPGTEDGYPSGVHARYAQPWQILAQALGEAHRRDEAADAADYARRLGPGP